jgi:hypothetical protein
VKTRPPVLNAGGRVFSQYRLRKRADSIFLYE